MSVPALGYVPFNELDSYELLEMGLDDATVALSAEALATEDGRRLVRALNIAKMAQADHARVTDRLRASDAHVRVASAAQPRPRGEQRPREKEIVARSGGDADVALAHLAVKANLHLAHDDETCSCAVGVGLYPACAMLNHSCMPTAVFSWSGSGAIMHVRASVDLSEGDEVTCSYLRDEQLYAPHEQRAAWLSAAFEFAPRDPPQRAELAARLRREPTASPDVRRRAQEAIAAVQQEVQQQARHAAQEPQQSKAPQSAVGLRAAVDRLEYLTHSELNGEVSPLDWTLQQCHAALLGAAQALDEPQLVAQSALHLLTVRQALLPIGTPHLAGLFAAHGSALGRLVASGEVAPDERAEVANAAARSLQAACKIRECCLGEQHPLSVATAAALRRS